MANARVARPVEFPEKCAMGLALGKQVEVDITIGAEIDGMAYYFANKEARATFMKDPEGNLAKARAYRK
jgi:YHS domain-containing protein